MTIADDGLLLKCSVLIVACNSLREGGERLQPLMQQAWTHPVPNLIVTGRTAGAKKLGEKDGAVDHDR